MMTVDNQCCRSILYVTFILLLQYDSSDDAAPEKKKYSCLLIKILSSLVQINAVFIIYHLIKNRTALSFFSLLLVIFVVYFGFYSSIAFNMQWLFVQITSNNVTSKTSVEFGGIVGGAPFFPYAFSGGIVSILFPPTNIP